MGGLFSQDGGGSNSSQNGGRRKRPAPAALSKAEKAQLELRRTITRGKKYETKLTKDAERLRQKAKALAKDGKRKHALGVLRLVKLKEKSIEKKWVVWVEEKSLAGGLAVSTCASSHDLHAA